MNIAEQLKDGCQIPRKKEHSHPIIIYAIP